MIYAVDEQNRAAYRAQIEEMFHTQIHRAAAYRPPGPHVCSRNGCPVCTKSVLLLDIDDFGGLTSGIIFDLTANPVAIATAFVDPQSLGGSMDEEWTLPAELTVALLEYALAMELATITLYCNPPLLPAAPDLQGCLLSMLSENCRVGRVLEVSYDIADAIRELFAVKGPILTYTHQPPPYASNENRRVRMVS